MVSKNTALAIQIAAFQRWREQQIKMQPIGVPFEFCGERYRVDITHDGRKILIGPTPQEYQYAA